MTEEELARSNAERFGLLAAILMFAGLRPLLFFLSLFMPGAERLRGSMSQLRVAARDALQDNFDQVIDRVAPIALQSLTAWHLQMKEIIEGYLLAQATVAKGRPLLPTEILALQPIINVQLAFLQTFLFDLLLRQITIEYVAARSKLYSGAGRALWYRINEEHGGNGWVIDYVAVDDRGPCLPCGIAELGGPYKMGDGPYPGEVCLGRGRCRCDRVWRFDQRAWAQL